MTEEKTNQRQFSIQKIYTKDISFETPNSPSIFTDKWKPEIDFNLHTNVEPLDGDMFEVCLRVTVTVKCENKTAYLAEANQAGIFFLSGFNDREKGPMLGSYCPNILFPYAREVISDLVTKGGFPQLLLAPVDFDSLFARHVASNNKNSVPDSKSIN